MLVLKNLRCFKDLDIGIWTKSVILKLMKLERTLIRMQLKKIEVN